MRFSEFSTALYNNSFWVLGTRPPRGSGKLNADSLGATLNNSSWARLFRLDEKPVYAETKLTGKMPRTALFGPPSTVLF